MTDGSGNQTGDRKEDVPGPMDLGSSAATAATAAADGGAGTTTAWAVSIRLVPAGSIKAGGAATAAAR